MGGFARMPAFTIQFGDKMTNYYDDEKNALGYIKMAEGYDGRALIEKMPAFLPKNSTVLELGMGPGTDLQLLNEHYVATGSDRALPFVERYRTLHPKADVLQLDAITLKTERKFDAIYSNKVLYHLTKDELQVSLARQAQLLNDGGYLFHSFWVGDSVEEQHGLTFVYYTEESLGAIIEKPLELVAIERYAEMEDDDSLWVVLRKI
jgi:SAM-dependent methyltransferase